MHTKRRESTSCAASRDCLEQTTSVYGRPKAPDGAQQRIAGPIFLAGIFVILRLFCMCRRISAAFAVMTKGQQAAARFNQRRIAIAAFRRLWVILIALVASAANTYNPPQKRKFSSAPQQRTLSLSNSIDSVLGKRDRRHYRNFTKI